MERTTARTHTVRAFEDRATAERAIEDLRERGWSEADIGFALHGEEAPAGINDAAAERSAEGAVTGAATGGLIGGLGAAAISLLIPGIGPIIGGGILASVLGGAAVGAAAGGLLGALTGLGVSEEEARFYDEEFRSGRPIVTARHSDGHDDPATIMHRHGGYDMESGRRDTGDTERVESASGDREPVTGIERTENSETSVGTTPVQHGSTGPTQEHQAAADMILPDRQGEGDQGNQQRTSADAQR